MFKLKTRIRNFLKSCPATCIYTYAMSEAAGCTDVTSMCVPFFNLYSKFNKCQSHLKILCRFLNRINNEAPLTLWTSQT